jgi:alpha-mannosidase/mannosylglycerate hydrolase
VVAPGLPEASVSADGVIALTALRAVGWLARFKLRTRPVPAGPEMPAPGAQCRGLLRCRLSLLPGADPVEARDAELGLRAVFAGSQTLAAEGIPLVSVEPATLVLSALKPAEDGEGIVARLMNPGGAPAAATIRIAGVHLSGATAVRLDEQPATGSVVMDGDAGTVSFTVPGHGVSSVRLRLAK